MADNAQTSRLAVRFNNSYTARLRSAALEGVHRTAFGDDYAVDTYTNGFYSGTTLRFISDALKLGPNGTLADWVVATAVLACGLPSRPERT